MAITSSQKLNPSQHKAEAELDAGRALVTASFGRQFELWLDGDSARISLAVTRGKKTDVSVGDWVRYRATTSSADQSVIESIEPRENEIKRSDAFRTKWLAANVDLAILVVAIDPPFSDEITTRVRCALDVAGVPLLLLLNKSDRREFLDARQSERLDQQITDLQASHVSMLPVSAKKEPEQLKDLLTPHMSGKTVLLLGQSGMGKSTILNVLVPGALAKTQEVSVALSSGKHTTTNSRLYEIKLQGNQETVQEHCRLIDSPGFQAFGLGHLSISQLNHAMPEFEPYLGQCRFNNCSHANEPGCAVLGALSEGAIRQSRYDVFQAIASDIKFADQVNLRS